MNIAHGAVSRPVAVTMLVAAPVLLGFSNRQIYAQIKSAVCA